MYVSLGQCMAEVQVGLGCPPNEVCAIIYNGDWHVTVEFDNFVCQYALHTLPHTYVRRCHKTDHDECMET